MAEVTENQSDDVQEYLRRFNKRAQTKKTVSWIRKISYGAIAVLFAIAAIGVSIEFFQTRRYLARNKPGELVLHEMESEDDQALAFLEKRTAFKAEPLDSKLNVSGCSDDSRRELWVQNCKELMDGKVYRRGHSGPFVSLMETKKPGTHAASLLELPDGTVLHSWFSGAEGSAGVVIVVSILPFGSDKWSTPKVVSEHKGRSNQNPVLHLDPVTKVVYIFHTSQEGGKGQGTSFIASVKSKDGGKTWSKPKKHSNFEDKGPFVKGKFLIGQKGEWLVPFYYTPDGFGKFDTHYSVMLRSHDHGETWEQSAMSSKGQMLAQPSVVRLHESGHLLAFFRDRKAEWIYSSVSTDDGVTWPSEPNRTKLPNNNSGIQAIILQNGHLVMVFNNLKGFMRSPLSIALSEDQGRTWPFVRDLEVGGRLDPVEPRGAPTSKTALPFPDEYRYSYPCVIQTLDERIHVAYTYRRKTMKHVIVDEEWIRAGGTIGDFKGDNQA